jgi:CheY-like chemotaxis protein
MEGENNQNFDLPALLRIDNLDIHRIAWDNLSLSLGEYFIKILKFLGQMPLATDAFGKIAAQKASEDDLGNIEDIKDLMEEIGCDYYTSALNDIISSCRMGHDDFAAGCVSKISGEINIFVSRIKTAENPDDTASAIKRNESLRQVLQVLDQGDVNRKMRILAVDDAPIILKTISTVLKNVYTVHGMTDPTKLESFLQQVTPELFLLDYQMPALNGFDLVPIIRNFKEHKDTPIIFLTSMGTFDFVVTANSLGASDFMVKPINEAILREKVAKHIVRKKLT